MPEGELAQRFVLADNFFHAAFGGSFINRFWLACACAPQWPNAPEALRVQLDPGGVLVKDGDVRAGRSDLLRGQQHVIELVAAIMHSPAWSDAAIIITYDKNGGRWDHVAPPVRDRWGPGTRVPAIVVSPFAKRRYVDHTQYDTTSILRLIEMRWNLAPLGTSDRVAGDLRNAFAF